MSDLFDMQRPNERDEHRLSRMDRRELAARKKRAAKRRRASMVATLIAVLVIGAGVVLAWNTGSKFLANLSPFSSGTQEPEGGIDFVGTGTEAVEVTVNQGDSGGIIAQTLVTQGVIKTTQAFTNAAIANPDSSRIQPGTYRLYKEIPASEAIEMLLDLENIVGNRIQVIPGHTADRIRQDIKKVTGLTDEQLDEAMKDTEARGLPSVADGSYEGWLADGDYRFGPEVTAEEIITEMVGRTVARLEKLEVPEDKWQEMLNVASIVQSEGKEDHFADIASVIYNRLEQGWRLEMDSTIHYKFGNTSDATTTAEQRADDNPWNTYKFAGLPKTPIASPSNAALKAAVSPNETDYMFFVAVNPVTGETKFAETNDQHNINRKEFQDWVREHRANEEAENTDG